MRFGLLLLCCKVIWAILRINEKMTHPDPSKPYVQSAKVEMATLIIGADYEDYPFEGLRCTEDSITQWGFADQPANYVKESIRGLFTRLSRGRFKMVQAGKVKKYRFDNYSITDSKNWNLPGKCYSWNTEISNLKQRDYGGDWEKKIDLVIIGMSTGGHACGGIAGYADGLHRQDVNFDRKCNWNSAYHELGHSLGFGHAGNDMGNDGRIDESYGDPTSIMGRGNYQFGFSAPELWYLSWLNTGAVVYARDDPRTGTDNITLNYLDNAASSDTGVQARIYHANPEPGKNTRLYFLSFRKATFSLENKKDQKDNLATNDLLDKKKNNAEKLNNLTEDLPIMGTTTPDQNYMLKNAAESI